MKKYFICLLIILLHLSLSAQEDGKNNISIEPHLGYLFIEKTDTKTAQRTKTTARGFDFNPHIMLSINPRFEIGLQLSITSIKSEFAGTESGVGYGIGYLLRYYPQKLIFTQFLTVREKKNYLYCHPYLSFKHNISTVYANEIGLFHFTELFFFLEHGAHKQQMLLGHFY